MHTEDRPLKTKQTTTTTIENVMWVYRYNMSHVSELLDMNRGTLRKIIKENRPHTIIVNDDGTLKYMD